MKTSNKSGFTIIEIMLFLAVSGMLVASVLVGTGTAINAQRYRDSVTSLQSNIKQQFSDVANVSNDRDSGWTCDGTGVSSDGSIPVGQSDCVLLGKYITNTDDGQLSMKNVVGYMSSSSSLGSGANDIADLQQIFLNTSDISASKYEIEWGSKIVKAGSNTPLDFSILIVRSPFSGVVRTFIDPDHSWAENDLTNFIGSRDVLTSPLKMCVESDGMFTGNTMAVMIKANASSSSAVEVLGDDSGC